MLRLDIYTIAAQLSLTESCNKTKHSVLLKLFAFLWRMVLTLPRNGTDNHNSHTMESKQMCLSLQVNTVQSIQGNTLQQESMGCSYIAATSTTCKWLDTSCYLYSHQNSQFLLYLPNHKSLEVQTFRDIWNISKNDFCKISAKNMLWFRSFLQMTCNFRDSLTTLEMQNIFR